jgi:Flp pilus assembly pilin Flp
MVQVLEHEIGRDRRVTKSTETTYPKEQITMAFLKNFWHEEQGQDLIEYTLLMAFVALASAALFLGAGGSIKGIWSVTNSQLAAASTQAS